MVAILFHLNDTPFKIRSHQDGKDRAQALKVNLPETTWHDGEQPGIPDTFSYSEDQEGPSQEHLVEISSSS